MPVKQTSGLEALLEALRQSGMNTDGVGGQGGFSAQQTSEADFDGDEGTTERRRASRGGGGRGGVPHFDMSFLDNIKGPQSKKALVALIIVVILILLVAYWWFHPPINIHSVDTWAFVAIFVLLPLFLFFATKSRTYRTGSGKVEKSPSKAKTFKWLSFIPVLVAVAGIVGGVLSMAIIPGNAEKYANVIKVDTLEFAEDIQEVDYSEIPVIDHDSASRLGNTQLGSIPEYVSQFEVSDLYSQINYHQEPVRVSPLNYADLFKWFTNRDNGLPAYALVNMTTQEAQIVSLPDGEGIKYSQSEPLARNIDRYVQLKYPFYMFDEKSFEIDEDGHPWWICPVQEYTIGLFGGVTVSRVVMVDAVTGECTDLAIEDCPQWVDRAYPSEMLIQQYNWHGAYSNGWLNSFLGQEGVVQTTPGTNGQQGYNYIAKDDDVWVYTGVTSATSDTSIVGFVLINQRTGEGHFYSVSGATEDRAMQSAEGAVQDLGYSSTFPLLINVSGRPTYFMSLKDGAGTVKQFAMVDIQSYQNVAVGNTVADTQKSYEALLATNGVDVDSGDMSSLPTANGTIRSMAQAVLDGNSHFYVTLDGDASIYDFALPGLLDIVSYRVGDAISFSYVDGTGAKQVYEILGADGEPIEATDAGAGADVDAGGAPADEAAATGDAGAAVAGEATA